MKEEYHAISFLDIVTFKVENVVFRFRKQPLNIKVMTSDV